MSKIVYDAEQVDRMMGALEDRLSHNINVNGILWACIALLGSIALCSSTIAIAYIVSYNGYVFYLK